MVLDTRYPSQHNAFSSDQARATEMRSQFAGAMKTAQDLVQVVYRNRLSLVHNLSDQGFLCTDGNFAIE